MDELIRFGTHAEIIRGNGFSALIPAIEKKPCILRYSEYAFHPADRIEFASWLRLYPAVSISFVVDGRVVVIDVDILDEDLVKEIVALATKMLGPVDFRRVGRAPKVAIFYRALDAVPTFAAAPVEIFSAPGSKQVLLFGRHPDTGGEYTWPGPCSPLTHRFEQMPGVRAGHVVAFREAALKIVDKSSYVHRAPRQQASASSSGPSHNVAGIGDMMAEILRAMGTVGADPLTVASSYFEQTPDGAKHYAMVASVSALVLRGYSDQKIVDALADAYQRRVHDDPSLRNLLVCPKHVRRGLLRRGAVLPDKPVSNALSRPEDDLDDDQCAVLDRAKRRLWDIFDDADELGRNIVVEQAVRAASRVRDVQVRAALAPSVAYWLALNGVGEAALLAVIELLSGRRDGGLARWALNKGRAHG